MAFDRLLIESHAESLVRDILVQYKVWGSSISAAPSTPEGWG